MFDADPARVRRIHRVLGVDEGADSAAALSLGDDVVDERGLARGLGAEDLDHAPPRQPAHPKSDVERERPGRDGRDRNLGLVAHLHDRSLAVLTLDLAEGGFECLLALQRVQPPNDTDSRISYSAPLGRRRDIMTATSDDMTCSSGGRGGERRGRSRNRATVTCGSHSRCSR